MRLTTKGRYAVMAMVDLAKHSDGEPVALADVADRQGISLSYLEQLFQKLRRAELVKKMSAARVAVTRYRKAPERCRFRM